MPNQRSDIHRQRSEPEGVAAGQQMPLRYASQDVASAVGELRDLTADVVLGGLDTLTPQERQSYERLRILLPGEAASLRAEFAGMRGLFEGVMRAEADASSDPEPTTKRRHAGLHVMPADVRRNMSAALWNASRQEQRVELASQMQQWRQLARISVFVAVALLVTAIGLGVVVLRLTQQTVDIGPLIADGPVEEIGGAGHVSYRIAEEAGAARIWMKPVAGAPEAAGGNVLWSDARQGGLAQIIGLPPNDAAVEQYQFWIVDADRPEGANRVPAGVFNVRERSRRDDQLRTLLLRPTLPVGQAIAFAVTREPAGGSILSDWRSNLVLYTPLIDDVTTVLIDSTEALPQ